jgi:hypothetical protein
MTSWLNSTHSNHSLSRKDWQRVNLSENLRILTLRQLVNSSHYEAVPHSITVT